MELNCNNCVENENSIFNCLSPEEKEILQKKYRCKNINKGDILFKEGDLPNGLICLSSGKVKVFKEGISGREQIVEMKKPVGFIGYKGLFAEEPHTVTAVAIEDSTICIFNKDSLFEVIKKNSELALKIIKLLASELEFTINRTVALTQKHIRGRLAESLLFLVDTYGYEEDGITIKVYLSREDIANLSSMTTSNAIRTLSSFANEQILALEGRKIKIMDLDKLKKISLLG